jgi:hypothetical protein
MLQYLFCCFLDWETTQYMVSQYLLCCGVIQKKMRYHLSGARVYLAQTCEHLPKEYSQVPYKAIDFP